MSSSKKKTNDILKQGTILAAASIFVRMIGVMYRIPLNNLLGEDGNGIYGAAYKVYSIALIVSSYGLPLAVSRMVAAKNVQGQYKNSHRIFINALIFATVIGAVVGGLIYFGADFFASFIGLSRAAMPLRVLAPTIFCVAVLGVLRGFFQGHNTMVPTAISQVLEQIVNAVISCVAAYAFISVCTNPDNKAVFGATGSTVGTFSGALVALLFMVGVYCLNRPVFKRKMDHDRHPVERNKVIYSMLFMTVVPVILSQTVYQISGLVDTSIFGNVMKTNGMSENIVERLMGAFTGQYNVLISVPLGIATAMGTSINPSIVASYTKGNMVEVKHKVKTVIKFNMLLAFPCAVGLAVLATPVNILLFPRLITYRAVASNMLLFGSTSLIFYALSTVTSGVLQALDHMSLPVIHSAISLIVHVILVYLLLRFTNLGVYALIVGDVTFPLLVCILNWRSVGKALNYKQEVRTTFGLPAIAAVIMGVCCLITYKILHLILGVFGSYVQNALCTILSICVAAVVYFVALLALKTVTEEELLEMPMGRTLFSIARKMHLI